MSAFVGFSLPQTLESTEVVEDDKFMPNATYEEMASSFYNEGKHSFLPEQAHLYYSSLYNHEAEQVSVL